MTEYIEREAVEKMLENAQIISDGEYCGYCTDDISVSSIPTADVAPVVHAKWIEKNCITGTYFECSNCHKPENKHTAIKGKYCWYCGAKMDLTGADT